MSQKQASFTAAPLRMNTLCQAVNEVCWVRRTSRIWRVSILAQICRADLENPEAAEFHNLARLGFQRYGGLRKSIVSYSKSEAERLAVR